MPDEVRVVYLLSYYDPTADDNRGDNFLAEYDNADTAIELARSLATQQQTAPRKWAEEIRVYESIRVLLFDADAQ